jgi:hypothetical protein
VICGGDVKVAEITEYVIRERQSPPHRITDAERLEFFGILSKGDYDSIPDPKDVAHITRGLHDSDIGLGGWRHAAARVVGRESDMVLTAADIMQHRSAMAKMESDKRAMAENEAKSQEALMERSIKLIEQINSEK